MRPSLFCHNCGVCNDILEQNIESEPSQITCSACGSDVVELVDSLSQTPTGNQPAGHNRPQLGNIMGNRSISGLTGPGRFFATFFNAMDRVGDDLPQEWIDRLTSQLMDEHGPTAKPTSKKARDNLTEVIVRPHGALGEPKSDEAFTCAGEPCSVCHDDFSEGEKVAELPCCHVCS
jgi:hypothetical protein